MGNWHHYRIGEEIKEIQKLHSNDFYKAKRSISMGRKSSKENHDHTNNNGCFLSVPSQFVLESRYSALVVAIELVRAAHSTSTKNRIPVGVPNPILANTLGMVMNISAGPACKVSGSPPENANTAGMIIRPAIMAIAVSNTSTFLVELPDRYVLFHI